MMRLSQFRHIRPWRRLLSTSQSAADAVVYGSVYPGIVSRSLPVPEHIKRPGYIERGSVSLPLPYIPILNKDQQKLLRESCVLSKSMLEYAGSLVKPGRTTDEIDRLVHKEIIKNGAYPSALGYRGYPKSICTSVNEVIVHGIPDSRALEEGDIVTIDLTVYFQGYHGDVAKTFKVGKTDKESEALMKFAEDCLLESIKKCCFPQSPFNSIGAYIHDKCENNKYEVLKGYGGHGIGQRFHQLPYIEHCRNDLSILMQEGMAFTIEPMICQGSNKYVEWDDGWTIATKDHQRAAQYEHTLLITQHGCEILTL